jgi:hypothetical protein
MRWSCRWRSGWRPVCVDEKRGKKRTHARRARAAHHRRGSGSRHAAARPHSRGDARPAARCRGTALPSTFLPIRPTRRQLATQRKPAAPRRPTQRHRIPRLGCLRQREELMTQFLQPKRQRLVNIVANNIEKAMRPAGIRDLLRNVALRRA